MRKTFGLPTLLSFSVAFTLCCSIVNLAQNREKFVISAKAGGINAITGGASVHGKGESEWQQLSITDDLDSGDHVRTAYDGRVEIAAHVNPIGYSELRYILEKNGFTIASVHRDKPKANTWAYWPIVTAIKIVSRLTPRQKRSERWTEELASKEVLLGGNTLIVHAVLN